MLQQVNSIPATFRKLTKLPYRNVEWTVSTFTYYWKTSLCWTTSVSSQRDDTCICCLVPAPAAWRQQLSIDISCPKGAQQQTRQPPLLLWINGTDRGRMLDCYIDPAPHTRDVGVRMLSESDNFRQIQNQTGLQTRLHRIRTHCSLDKALIHHLLLSVVCRTEVNKCTVNSYFLMSA